jgi:hypothetical protein
MIDAPSTSIHGTPLGSGKAINILLCVEQDVQTCFGDFSDLSGEPIRRVVRRARRFCSAAGGRSAAATFNETDGID